MHVASIQQPQYFPWLGYFEQLKVSDTAVLLDCVQWTKQGRQHRSEIQQRGGARSWLSIPVQSKDHRSKSIRDMRVDNSQNWKTRHWRQVEASYRRSPYFESQLEPILYSWFSSAPSSDLLADTVEEGLKIIGNVLDVNHQFQLSSQLSVSGNSTERLVNLCRELGSDVYYSSLGSALYLDLAKFRPFEIRVITQHWRAPANLGNLSIVHALAEMPLAEIRESLEPKPWSFFGQRGKQEHSL